MSFRTVEITGPAEIHVKNGALLIEKEKKAVFSEDREIKEESNDEKKKSKKKTGKEEMEIVRILIPLEDISTIICMGAGIRISTMAMAKICDSKISMMMLNEKYQPSGILSAYEANARRSLTMRQQVYLQKERADSSTSKSCLPPKYQSLFNDLFTSPSLRVNRIVSLC